ncbi:MAG: hypothetical protein CMQ20_10115 [Gammaproteobacteria bacterium]|jgi:NAD(P)-dependent dehydrogenase (short-subunit alcohol dehydrogenase family)|nr:hypothetical protein [Gammaproteobacteria bacterium]|tara:strand:+ start:24856 stop:25686 length:831 start_codon:yes stop_codon:yes gene_type:complete
MDIEGKTAVITGGSAGIGLAIANALADAGIGAIVIGDIDDANGEAAVAGIIDKGAKSVYKHTDVSNADDIRALFDEAVKNFGQVDIVFNNAGIMLGEPAWPEVAIERLGLGVQINLLGVMYGTRVAIDVLSQSGGGLIINTASPAGFGPLPPDPMYAATKAAIINFTLSCATLQASHNIRVNAILPGTTDTAILNKSGDGTTPAAWLKPFIGMLNLLTVEDIAKGAIDVIEDDSRVGEALSIENPAKEGGEAGYIRLRDNTEFHERALGNVVTTAD